MVPKQNTDGGHDDDDDDDDDDDEEEEEGRRRSMATVYDVMDVYGITARVGKSGKGADNIAGLWSLQGSFGLH